MSAPVLTLGSISAGRLSEDQVAVVGDLFEHHATRVGRDLDLALRCQSAGDGRVQRGRDLFDVPADGHQVAPGDRRESRSPARAGQDPGGGLRPRALRAG